MREVLKVGIVSFSLNLLIGLTAITTTALTPNSPNPALQTLLFHILCIPANFVAYMALCTTKENQGN